MEKRKEETAEFPHIHHLLPLFNIVVILRWSPKALKHTHTQINGRIE